MGKLFDMGMDRRSALKLMSVASVSALAMGAGLVGCGQNGGDGGDGGTASTVKGAKYYQVDQFASMSGEDQLKELTNQGFGYFDSQNDYYWACSPNENPFTGTVWITFHSVDVDEEGYDVMSRDAVTENKDINYLEVRWDNVESPADSPEGTLQNFVDACGLGEIAGQGWTTNKYSYVGFGTCSLENEDGYWVVEITANYDTNENGEYAPVDNAYVRVFVGRMNGMTIEDIENSYLPSEEDTVQLDDSSATTTEESADTAADEDDGSAEALIDNGAISNTSTN